MTVYSNMAAVPPGYVYYDASAKKTLSHGTLIPTPGPGDYIVPATTSMDGYYHEYRYYTSGNWGDISYTNSWVGQIQSRYSSAPSHQAPLALNIGGKPIGVFLYQSLTMTTAPDLDEYTNLFYVSFLGDSNLEEIPKLPSSIRSLNFAFSGTNITEITNIQSLSRLETMYSTFQETKITSVPDLSSLTNVVNMNAAFYKCSSLVSVGALPPNVTNLANTFANCSSLTKAPVIPEKVNTIHNTFGGCTVLEGFILILPETLRNTFSLTFKNTTKQIILVAASTGASNYSLCKQIANASPSNVYNGIKAVPKSQTAIRCLSDGTEDSLGSYVKISIYYEAQPSDKEVYYHSIILKEDGVLLNNISWYKGSLSGNIANVGDVLNNYTKLETVVPVSSDGSIFSYTFETSYNAGDYGKRYIQYSDISVTLTNSDFLIDISSDGESIGIFKEASDSEGGLLIGKMVKNPGEILEYDYSESPNNAFSIINNSEVTSIDWQGNLEASGDISATGSLKGAGVLINGTSVADFVVEQGTSGNWSYTKWNSGKLECWFSGNPGSYAVSSARGSLYSGNFISYTYPIQFISAPSVTANVTLSASAYAVFTHISSASATGCQIRICSSGSISASSAFLINIYAIGKWK